MLNSEKIKCVQVKFESTEPMNTEGIVGGIALYEGDKLLGVICGNCGGFVAPHEATIHKMYNAYWVPLTEEIIGDDDDQEGLAF